MTEITSLLAKEITEKKKKVERAKGKIDNLNNEIEIMEDMIKKK